MHTGRGMDADVVVVGAGPAGIVCATRMVQLGLDACLIERSRFPRSRLGESLTPGVMPMLASAGLWSAVAATTFTRVRRVSVRWDSADTIREDPGEHGMLVDRATFDSALLERAREIGVRVLQPADVRHHVEDTDGWVVSVDTPSGPVDIRARFLVDATGRSRRLGAERRVVASRTIAIHGYWTGDNLPTEPRIEAGEHEWYWGVPIPGGSYNTLVFVDGERFREEPTVSLDQRLVSLIAQSSLANDVRGATLRAPARAADATPYVVDECIDERRLSIGDAALALDPLSSSGVQKAIQTALSGAIVANTLLRRPELRNAAIRFYRDSVREAADRHHAWATTHYATAAKTRRDTFWTDRAGSAMQTAMPDKSPPVMIEDDVPLRLSADSRWEERPCLGAQFVEMHPALLHPGLDGPVAFVGGESLATLLKDAPAGVSSRELAAAWSARMTPSNARSIVRWLSGLGVLEAVTSSGGRV